MKVVMFSTKSYDQEHFERYNQNRDIEFTFLKTSLNAKTVDLTAGFDAVCVFVNDDVDAEIITKMAKHGIGLIALRCAGFNNVDLKAAAENNIKVARVPAYSPEAVAEHTMALILTLNRKTHKAYNRVREGNFSLQNLLGFNLQKKTVGVVGAGKIGIAFCRILKGFGCHVLVFDPHESDEVKEMGAEYVSLDDLLGRSDIVSLHCPLMESTKHLINSQTLSLMKQGVMLINTSRGGLVDTKSVIEALKHRKLGALGIDVYEQEEDLFFEDHSERIIEDDYILRLNSFPNVLITSHQAFFTEEAMYEITTTTLENIEAFRSGGAMKNEIK